MNTDDPVMSYFESLSRDEPAPVDISPDYPGSTKPRNRSPQPVVDEQPSTESLLDAVPAVQYLVNGEMQKFYTVGSLGALLDRDAVTIRSWESKGWLPKARYRSPNPVKEQIPGREPVGKRLYTRAQALCLVEGFTLYIKVYKPKKPDWVAFRAHIRTNYPIT